MSAHRAATLQMVERTRERLHDGPRRLVERAKRVCLRCRRLFMSAHRGNRLCPACTEHAERWSSSIA